MNCDTASFCHPRISSPLFVCKEGDRHVLTSAIGSMIRPLLLFWRLLLFSLAQLPPSKKESVAFLSFGGGCDELKSTNRQSNSSSRNKSHSCLLGAIAPTKCCHPPFITTSTPTNQSHVAWALVSAVSAATQKQ